MQVDFGQGAWIEADGKRRRPHLFRAVLSHSRKAYSEVVWRQDTETFIRCVENAFRPFGGVTRTIIVDNLKAAVLDADWFDPTLNPKMADFARFYGTTVLPTQPARPEHKGKIEAGVKYAQNNALKGRTFSSVAELSAAILRFPVSFHRPVAGAGDDRLSRRWWERGPPPVGVETRDGVGLERRRDQGVKARPRTKRSDGDRTEAALSQPARHRTDLTGLDPQRTLPHRGDQDREQSGVLGDLRFAEVERIDGNHALAPSEALLRIRCGARPAVVRHQHHRRLRIGRRDLHHGHACKHLNSGERCGKALVRLF